MSDSYPTIQDSLSDVQRDFMGCVEMHLDPPEHDSPTYTVEALFDRSDGDSIRFRLVVDEDDADISERSHAIEFIDTRTGRLRGWVRHSMKRIEALSGRFLWTESHFEVAGPGIAEGSARQTEVEREVKLMVDEIRVLDRARKLSVAQPVTDVGGVG